MRHVRSRGSLIVTLDWRAPVVETKLDARQIQVENRVEVVQCRESGPHVFVARKSETLVPIRSIETLDGYRFIMEADRWGMRDEWLVYAGSSHEARLWLEMHLHMMDMQRQLSEQAHDLNYVRADASALRARERWLVEALNPTLAFGDPEGL